MEAVRSRINERRTRPGVLDARSTDEPAYAATGFAGLFALTCQAGQWPGSATTAPFDIVGLKAKKASALLHRWAGSPAGKLIA